MALALLKTTIGDYQLKDVLGLGTFGKVWLAHDLNQNRDVALKLLRQDRLEDLSLQTLKTEYEILSHLRQDYLAQVYNFGLAGENQIPFLTSEYCSGKPLFEACAGKPLDFFEEVLAQILSALDSLHAQGIVHLDLKSENILVREEDGHPRVKILDFGIAARLGVKLLGQRGTPATMAPEILAGSLHVDLRSDLYALGILSYYILTQTWPFPLGNVQAVMEWHRSGLLPSSFSNNKDIPEALKEMVTTLLAKKTSDRFSNARVVIRFLNLATGNRFEKIEKSLKLNLPIIGPLVDRDEFMAAFRKPASSPVTVLSGQRGSGKTRLLEELRHEFELVGIPIHEFTGDYQQPQIPWLLKKTGLDEALNQGGSQALLHALLHTAAEQPFVILVDDFHKTDPDFQSFILSLMGRLKNPSPDQKNPLHLVITTTESMPEASVLNPLTQEGVLRYIRYLVGDQDQVPALAEKVFDYCGGLPALMVEGLRYLLPAFLKGERIEGISSLPSVIGLYEQRISSLTSGEKELLTLLALVFKPLDGEDIERFCSSLSEEDAYPLSSLRAAGLVNVDLDQKYRLSSQALILALIENVPPGLKGKYHERIARILRENSRTPQEEIAYHWGKAGKGDQAVALYEAAGRHYKKKGLILLAGHCFEKALRLIESGSSKQESLSLEYARLQLTAGNYQQAEHLLQSLKDSFSKEELNGYLHLKQGQIARARSHFEKALQSLPKKETLKEIEIKNALANLDLQENKIEAALQVFQSTLDLENKLPTGVIINVSNNNLGLALSQSGRFEEALSFFKQRLSSGKITKVSDQVSLLGNLGYVYLRQESCLEAISFLKQAVDLALQSGTTHELPVLTSNLIAAYTKEGRYGEGIKLLQQVLAVQKEGISRREASQYYLSQAGLYLNLGQKQACSHALQQGREVAAQTKDTSLDLWFLLMEGFWAFEFGSLQEATLKFEVLKERAKEKKDDFVFSWALLALSETFMAAQKRVDAKRILAQIKADADEEFSLRHQLLTLRIQGQEGKQGTLDESFEKLARRTQEKKYPELLWEVLEAWGQWKVLQADSQGAEGLFQKASQAIRKTAQTLPEEFQKTYLESPRRKKILEKTKPKAPLPRKTVSSLIPGPPLKETLPMSNENLLAHILELSNRMIAERQPERLLELILDSSIELSGAEEGLFLILDGDGHFEPRLARNIRKEDGETVRFSQSIADQVVKTGRTSFSMNAATDLSFNIFDSVVATKLKSFACVPLKIRNKIVGVLYLATQQRESSEMEESLPALEIFAKQAATALHNMESFVEEKKAKENLEEELIQKSRELEEKEVALQSLESMVTGAPADSFAGFEKIIGQSKKMGDLLQLINRIAPSKVSVYILGETGTGKEVLAKSIHERSPRKSHPFIAINCSAFSETLLESELFGYHRGAFTGADRDHAGLFERASQGTLFLDEIADMNMSMQAKILRVIQEQEILRVGGKTTIKIDVRLIGASNRDLTQMVKEGQFRQDLYFRLAGMTLKLPPLRERREDLPLLIHHFLGKIRKENNLSPKIKISKKALAFLLRYDWPGNIRELEQTLTSACFLTDGEMLPEHLLLQDNLLQIKKDSSYGDDVIGFDPDKKLKDYEMEIIEKALHHCKGNKSHTAKLLGISRLTLHKKLAATVP